jgi:hypothetical protein
MYPRYPLSISFCSAASTSTASSRFIIYGTQRLTSVIVDAGIDANRSKVLRNVVRGFSSLPYEPIESFGTNPAFAVQIRPPIERTSIVEHLNLS